MGRTSDDGPHSPAKDYDKYSVDGDEHTTQFPENP